MNQKQTTQSNPSSNSNKAAIFILLILAAIIVAISVWRPMKKAGSTYSQLEIQRDSLLELSRDQGKMINYMARSLDQAKQYVIDQRHLTDSILEKYESTKQNSTSYHLHSATVHELDSFWSVGHYY